MVHRDLRVGFMGFGRKTFDTAAAERFLADSISFLTDHATAVRAVPTLVTDVGEVAAAAAEMECEIDLLIAQFTTFVDGRFIETAAHRLGVPVVVWAVREPNRGTRQRLALNSLTGANLACHALTRAGVPFQFLFGNPGEPETAERLESLLRLFAAYQRLRGFKVVTLGDAPDGFAFSAPGERARAKLCIAVERMDLAEVFGKAQAVPDEVADRQLRGVRERVRGVERLPEDAVRKFAKLRAVLKQELERAGADAVAVRCWPEFFTEFGAAACSTVSALIDEGVMASCEADVLGALSMDVLSRLTGGAAYLGDLVEVDASAGAVTFWHCGAGAVSLARQPDGAAAGVHPNRGLGFTLEFGLKPGRVTIFRIGEGPDGTPRALIGAGTVLDEPQRFLGTSGRVRLDPERPPRGSERDGTVDAVHGADRPLTARITRLLEAGFEPHYALAYGDVAGALEQLCALVGLDVTWM
ncbi:MAG: hypothetical protein K6T78_11415 [Alicyclobacillus sp.]|nr:hypothetical protein [Alicyclobacillus sp.]